MTKEDIEILKKAYLNHDGIVTLSDGRMVLRQNAKRFNSCTGCAFKHELGCYCEDGEIWSKIKG